MAGPSGKPCHLCPRTDLLPICPAAQGLFLWADTIRRWRLGLPTMTDLEGWARTTQEHLALRILREEFRQTDDSQWREQRLQSDSEDRRNLVHFLYVTSPPRNRYERELEAEDALEDRRREMLCSRLTREVDPDEAQGEFWRIVKEAEHRGATLWPLDLKSP